MNIRNFVKAIFFVSALINLSPLGKATELFAIELKNNPQSKYYSWFKKVVPSYDNFSQNRKLQQLNNNYLSTFTLQSLPTTNRTNPVFLASSNDIKNELEIQSEIQSEQNNILDAKGNVVVFYKNDILKSDTLIYDKTNKILSAKGNVTLNIGEQLFKMVSFQYDFKNNKGYLLDVKGFVKTDNLIDDLFSDLETSNIKNTEILEEIKKDKVLNTPNQVNNWILFSDKIEVNGNKWTSEKVIFTNDLLELKQVKIAVNSLEVISRKEELRFKSSLNYLILDEKLSIPFLFGNRTLNKSGESFSFLNRWNLGLDNFDRDGYFIGRKFNTISLFNDFVLDLEPQYLFERSLKGYTKSFVNKGDSITGNKVKRDTTFPDYFALNSQIKGKINKWVLEIDSQIYSFESGKLSDAIRFKTDLSKEINFLQSKWNKSFYGVYRDRIWNGSIGEAEIYKGYGSKLEKENTWEIDGIKKTEILSLNLANIEAEGLNSKNLVNSFKGDLFYSLDQKFPLGIEKSSNKFIDRSYEYISEPINKGLSLNTKVEILYSLYKGSNNQNYLGFGAGPELILGNFKNKSFDYSRISILPFYKIKSGNSLFKFDQISERFSIDIAYDQQLYGPLILKSNATINLDSDSKDYGDFINSKISLNWKKRSYELGIFYQPHNKSGGILFTLFGFE